MPRADLIRNRSEIQVLVGPGRSELTAATNPARIVVGVSGMFPSVRMVARLFVTRPKTYGQAWLSALASAPLLLAVLLIGGWALRFGGWPWEIVDLQMSAWSVIVSGIAQSYKVGRARRHARPAQIYWSANHPDRP